MLTPDELAALDGDGVTGGLPNRAYTSEEFLAAEREALFTTTWTCVGHACRVPEPGDLRPVDLLGVPLVLVRGTAGDVAVFHNVCRHRGNQLVWEACSVGDDVSCPYHGWTYGLDGALLATPHVGGWGTHRVDGLDRADHGLRRVRSAVWLDLVFVDLSGTAPPFDEHIAPLQARVDALASPAEFARLRPAATHGSATIEFAGNWKLCAENNLEAYHLPWVHPGLNSVSRLRDHEHLEPDVAFAGQRTTDYDHTLVTDRLLPAFDGWPDRIAEYPTLYPNVFLGLQRDHFWTRILEPVSAGTTRDHLQVYYLGEAADDDGFDEARAQRLTAWLEVFEEDVGVVAGLQRGRSSPSFDGGLFTPVMDEPSRHFSRWVAARLASG